MEFITELQHNHTATTMGSNFTQGTPKWCQRCGTRFASGKQLHIHLTECNATLCDILSNGSVLQDLGAPFFVESNVLDEQKLADSTKAADQSRASPHATDGAHPGMLKRAKTGKHERQQDRSQPEFSHAEPSEVSAKRAKQSFLTEQRIDLNSLPSAVRIVLVKSHHHETLGRLMGVGVRVRGQLLDTSKTAIPISTTMSAAGAVAMAHAVLPVVCAQPVELPVAVAAPVMLPTTAEEPVPMFGVGAAAVPCRGS